jgi:periplasmic protein TonB
MNDPKASEEEDERGFLERHRAKIMVVVVLAVTAGGIVFMNRKQPPKEFISKPQMSMVDLLPPPPPPPPPPPKEPEPPPPEEQMEEEKVEEFIAEENLEPDPEPQAAEADAGPTTSIAGDGDDGFGLRQGRGGNLPAGFGIGGPRGGAGGGRFTGYAAKVQGAVSDALRRHQATRSAALTVEVRIWADSLGRVSRAQLVRGSGDSAIDQALRGEILTGLQLAEPPPADMPMPINLRISARKPN